MQFFWSLQINTGSGDLISYRAHSNLTLITIPMPCSMLEDHLHVQQKVVHVSINNGNILIALHTFELSFV